jgi:DNA-binding transcriptional LysR family regulator
MIASNVGIGILPYSAASRHAKSMSIRIVELKEEWAIRKLQICVKSVQSLPVFARELIEMLVETTAE